ncbi:MAG: glycosyltransferase family 4 protein [Candidatus Paceibacterota bacterium]|jgi:glycosyltransferase involved in cell wall biosynthesis
MKLLIITQKVDKDDPILGFFHGWIVEFAGHCESVVVICLEKGAKELLVNAEVLSLGKEDGISRVKYLWRFYRHIWKERKNYDAVFVHMNPIYVVLGGLLWRMLGKKISLWYTHKNVDWKLRLAEKFTHKIFTASKESFRLSSRKVQVMGHGIDVDFFSPDTRVIPGNALLSVGRLMPTKRHDLVIEASALVGRPLRIAGEGSLRLELENLVKKLGASVEFLGPLTQAQLRDEYRKAAFLVHTSETGSLDKVVLEALACGLRVITTSTSLSGLPIMKAHAIPKAIAEVITATSGFDRQSLVSYVRENHSLQNLIPKILGDMKNI